MLKENLPSQARTDARALALRPMYPLRVSVCVVFGVWSLPLPAQHLSAPVWGDAERTQHFYRMDGAAGGRGQATENHVLSRFCEPVWGGQGRAPDDKQLSVAVLPDRDWVSGVVVQSQGGAGGAGGDNHNPVCLGYRGGDGGDGGDGGSVSVQYDTAPAMTSTQFRGTGVLVESLGGHGGAGGHTAQTGAAGQGGQGGEGRSVAVTNHVAIETTASGGYGIWARSAGGWGGDGGGASFWVPTQTRSGSGSAGSSGGAVRVDNHARLQTPHGIPIFAQSIGGQGGRGGQGGSVWASINRGERGAGGYGGPGHAVTVHNHGNLNTAMHGGFGVLAQSVGGGGGVAGEQAGLLGLGATGGYAASAGKVVIHNLDEAVIVTQASTSPGLFAQSVGGGGGAGGLAVGRVSVGGRAGHGGHGGTVQASNTGAILTGGACIAMSEQGACQDYSVKPFVQATNGAAFGVLAQSIGGGGGSGGMGASGNLGLPSVSLGGSGSDGGNGGRVQVANNGLIVTVEPNSAGVLAQSVGGGGGTGGGAVSVNGSFLLSLGGSDGGAGGAGGHGGAVAVNCPSEVAAVECAKADAALAQAPSANARILTAGQGSPGIQAQSVGGGGGHGGFALTVAASDSVSVAVALGGSGGAGGQGGRVYARPAGVAIETFGADSPGIAALSTGGGGGYGSYSIAGAVAGELTLTTSVGGTGGAGGAAQAVTLLNKSRARWQNSPITTHGARSHGMVAQSIGGGGGSAGGSIGASVSGMTRVGLSLGGRGGAGQTAAAVSLDNEGTITTHGAAASALVAQSVGGGGGQGNYAISGGAAMTLASDFAIGGHGGAGASAGAVTLNNSAPLFSHGGGAAAMLAQSVGGGGGSGGVTSAATLSFGGASNFGVGGTGGSGARSGSVTVTNSAAVHSTHHAGEVAGVGQGNSPGIVAQSIGGGGGWGGYALGAAVAEAGAVLAVGGTAGVGGQSDAVSVISDGRVTTEGDLSGAVLAQSVAGVGGHGGMALAGQLSGTSLTAGVGGSAAAGGTAGPVFVQTREPLNTQGQMAPGIVAQSVGGAGGSGGVTATAGLSAQVSLSAAIGSGGAAGGQARAVQVDHRADIQTLGAQSSGIVAQSIGGAGGVGGCAVGASASQQQTGQVSVAGQGGRGGIAAPVTVTTQTKTTIATQGDQSSALVAQSIGGAGGSGGLSAAGSLSTAQASVVVAGAGAHGGQAAASQVNNRATLKTDGSLSNGILAQSIGGSGGSGAYSSAGSVAQQGLASVRVGAHGAQGGQAGLVSVDNTADIRVAGAQSSAIVAQSLGGAGGHAGMHLGAGLSAGTTTDLSVGSSGGTGGQAGVVEVHHRGHLSSQGPQAVALVLQSVGGSGGNAGQSVSGTVGSDASFGVTVGGGSGAGSRSANVRLESRGTVESQGEGAGAVLAQSVGGSGGRGAQTLRSSLGSNLSGAVLLGGGGAPGGAAGDVSLRFLKPDRVQEKISSRGALSTAILAQSIGGNGGSASFSGVISGSQQSVTLNSVIGGSGGMAGTSGSVDVTLEPGVSVQTQGLGASGLVAQSIAGTGGAGGTAFSGGFSAETTSVPVGVAVGGSGGHGGHGAAVTVNVQDAEIVTDGLNALGLVAQSIGGSGGMGGHSRDFTMIRPSASQAFAASLTVGGPGGHGAQAGSVRVTHRGRIKTVGEQHKADGSIGLLAQSIGGGGGHGGHATSDAVAGRGTVSLAVGGAAAGSHEAHDVAGSVEVFSNHDHEGSIETSGMNASALVAQSIGGGGGTGGWSQSSAASTPYALGMAVGGWGGQAGAGGRVAVTAGGTIRVTGDQASGLVAQSIGGGGGLAGAATAQASAQPGAAARRASAVVGAALKKVGLGEYVANYIETTLVGKALPSTPQPAPERGASLSLAVGGAGGQGGVASDVAVHNHAAVLTLGLHGHGVLAQSIGGGGGVGSSSGSGTDGGVYAAALSVGGFGGRGGVAGVVRLHNHGAITTHADHAKGLTAQSVGGGGGSNVSRSASTMVQASGPVAVGVNVGGWGGTGGSSGQTRHTTVVEIVNRAAIATRGVYAHGIEAQSVGGGGGSAGSTTMRAEVSAAENGEQAREAAASAQVGGDEADRMAPLAEEKTSGAEAGKVVDGQYSSQADAKAGTAVGLTVGGFGGSGGFANNVRVSNRAPIVTGYADSVVTQSHLGAHAVAIVAQSIGGGGGQAASTNSHADAQQTSVSLALGGHGGTGAESGDVVVENEASLQTWGHHAPAILAQSVAGGGGRSGTLDITTGSAGPYAAAFGLGGTAGAAGQAGSVQVLNAGAEARIQTVGEMAAGILAQSVGGGGGDAGSVTVGTHEAADAASQKMISERNPASDTPTKASVSDSGSVASAQQGAAIAAVLGSRGGAGGHGLRVAVLNRSSIQTVGALSPGIAAQSIGGGGGHAGAALSQVRGDAYQLNLALGGRAGQGGAAANVQVMSFNDIATQGVGAQGIVAQSIGGGGGKSQMVVADSQGKQQAQAVVAIAMGAQAGRGSQSGDVRVVQQGWTRTTGDQASALVAQSVSGGGGLALSSQSSAQGGKAKLTLALGASGGEAAPAGSVEVYVTNGIQTAGHQASAVLAQSIAGGGGQGASRHQWGQQRGDLSASFALGGSGGCGSRAGTVLVTSSQEEMQALGLAADVMRTPAVALIRTKGEHAAGIVAQSIGGGGGDGGMTSSAVTRSDDSQQTTRRLALTLGAHGAAGGHGGDVTVHSALPIRTEGAESPAILAQSIGGGGGRGGVSVKSGDVGRGWFEWHLGGSSGSGGDAGQVRVLSEQTLQTQGSMAPAIVAQSIAGGGGLASASGRHATNSMSGVIESMLGSKAGVGGSAQSVNVVSNAAIQTGGDHAMGILAQSIAGGGGLMLLGQSRVRAQTVTLGLGASTGQAQEQTTARDVQILMHAPIQTRGVSAIGVAAQSIAGGGGVSLIRVAGEALSLQANRLGAENAVMSQAGTVVVQQTASLRAEGQHAVGILAQSVAGGGGYVSLASASPAVSVVDTSLSLGAQQGQQNHAGDVHVTVDAPINVVGAGAVGVLAQSVGGGGGAFVSSAMGALRPVFVAGHGSGGSVSVDVHAPVTAEGAGAYGILAQSVGGGGGLVLSEQGLVTGSGGGSGTAGAVVVDVSAPVHARGGGVAIYAGSAKGDRDPQVRVAPGVTVSATEGAKAIVLEGAVNVLNNEGHIVVSDPRQTAVEFLAGGQSTLLNSGMIRGAIVNTGQLMLLNAPGASLEMGERLSLGHTGRVDNYGDLRVTQVLGAQSVLANHGSLSAGTLQDTRVLTLEGSLEQTAGGELHLNIDAEKEDQPTDSIVVAGNAQLDGEIVTHARTLLPQPYVWVRAAKLDSRVQVRDTYLFDWSVQRVGSLLQGRVRADLSPKGENFSPQQRATAQYLQQLWEQRDRAFGALFAYLHGFQPGQSASYQQVLNQISGQSLNQQALALQTSLTQTLNDSMSCAGSWRKARSASLCSWGRIAGQRAMQSGLSAGNPGYRSSQHGLQLGMQRRLKGAWKQGVALDYHSNTLRSMGMQSQGQFLQGAMSLQKYVNDWEWGATLGFAQGWVHNSRQLRLPSQSASWPTLASNYRSQSLFSMLSGQISAAYTHRMGHDYLRPSLGMALQYRNSPGMVETGGALALRVHAQQHWSAVLTPMLEWGRMVQWSERLRYQVHVGLGARLLVNNNVSTRLSFAQATDPALTYQAVTRGPSVLGHLNLGLQAIDTDGLAVVAQYALAFGSGYLSQRLQLDLRYRF